MQIESRDITSSHAMERYLTAIPDPAAAPADEARRMFDAIRQEASQCDGRICSLRVFVPDGAMDAYREAWQSDGPCSWLRAGPGAVGGVQAHVVAGPVEWRPLVDDAGRAAGWSFRNGQVRWAVVGGLEAPRTEDDVLSTRASFEAAERLIAQADMSLSDVARTWFFLDDILGWYDRFNVGRNDVFQERGLLAPATDGATNVPASTGIGVSPACGSSRLAMELFAVAGKEDCIVRRPAAGRQRCAYEYGSAFARVAEAATPAGRTVFVSGTAAIDKEGRTCFVNDADGQIRMTLDNVLAVLAGASARRQDVLQAIAYCKTPAVADRFAEAFRDALPWPWVTVVGDVCRPDLLFEAEVTAARPVSDA